MMPMLRRMVLRNSRTSFTMNVGLRRGGVTAARCKTDSMYASACATLQPRSTMTRSAARRSFSSLNRSRARACRSESPPSRNSVTHAGESRSSLSLFATALCDLPSLSAACSCDRP